MGIINFTGFEEGEIQYSGAYGGTFVSPVGQSAVFHTGTYAAQVNPTGTQVSNFQIGSPSFDNPTTLTTPFAQTYFNIGTLPATADEIFMVLGASQELQFRITSTGIIKLYVYDLISTTTLVATGTTTLATSQWYKITYYYVDSTKSLQVWINGNTEFNITLPSQLITTNQVKFTWGKVRNINGNTVNFYYDDLVIADTQLVKDYQVVMAVPASAGTYTQWSGTFQSVDEIPPDTNTTISASGTSPLYSTFNTGTVGTFTSYDGVKITSKISPSSLRTDIVLRAVSGTTIQDYNINSIGNSGFVYYEDVLLTDPATSGAWTQTSANNLQIGIGIAGGAGSDIGSVAATVIYKNILYSNTYVGSGGVLVQGFETNRLIANPVISGGAVVSGRALRQAILEEPLTPSGALASGTATIKVAYSGASTGGALAGGTSLFPATYTVPADTTPPSAVAGGTALVPTDYTPSASGGVVVGGLGLLNWFYTGSGGAKASGAATALDTYNISPSGGAVVSGVGVVVTHYTATPTSGAIAGGAAIVPSTYNYTASGGVVCAGHPLENTSFTASGKAVAGGSAVASISYVPPSSGGAIVSGVNNYSGVANFTGSGGVKVGGITVVDAIYLAPTAGGAVAGGHGTSVFTNIASGGALVGGTSSPTTQVAVGGGVTVRGAAIVESLTSDRRYVCLVDGQIGVDARFVHPNAIAARRKYQKIQDIDGAFLPAVTVCELLRENRMNNFN